MQRNSDDGQHRQPNTGPAGGDTGQRTAIKVPYSRTALSIEDADQYPSRTEIEREWSGSNKSDRAMRLVHLVAPWRP